MAVTVRAIMIEATSIFVNAYFSSSILITLDNTMMVRVKVKSIDKPLITARPIRPKN